MKKSTDKRPHGDGCLNVYNNPLAKHCTMEDLKNGTACFECRCRQPRLCRKCAHDLENGHVDCKNCGHVARVSDGNDYSNPKVYQKVKNAQSNPAPVFVGAGMAAMALGVR